MSRPEILQLSLTLVPSSHSIANLLPSPSNFAYLSFSSIFGHQFPSSLPKLAHEFTDSDSSFYPFPVSRPHLQRNPLSRKLRLSPVPKLSVPLPVSILGSKSKPFTMRPCIVSPIILHMWKLQAQRPTSRSLHIIVSSARNALLDLLSVPKALCPQMFIRKSVNESTVKWEK